MKFLCIDDEPIRFDKLAKTADCFVTDRPEVVEFYLKAYDFDAVLLDHDMPLWTGVEVARLHLIERGIPVIVHSANDVGANNIMLLLREYAVPCYRLSVLETNWEARLQNAILRRSKVMLKDPKPTEDPIADWNVVAAEMRHRYKESYSFCVNAGDRLVKTAEKLVDQLDYARACIKGYESLWCVRVYLWIKNRRNR